MIMEKFTDKQLEALRTDFGKIKTVDPKHLPRFHHIFAQCSDHALKQLAEAEINFVSKLAANAARRRTVQTVIRKSKERRVQ